MLHDPLTPGPCSHGRVDAIVQTFGSNAAGALVPRDTGLSVFFDGNS